MLTLLLTASLSLPPVIPVSDIKPGQKGECLTVFEGDTVESFPFVVKGVMRNFLGPRKDVVLVKLLGDKAEFTGAKAEVKKTDVKLDLPAVPQFDVPTSSGATHGSREMRLTGNKLLDTKVEVKGYITWIYDCAIAGGVEGEILPDQPLEAKRKYIAEHPEACFRPHFFIGDSADTAPHRSVWIVDVPRPLRADELKPLTSEEKKALPPPPVYALGDEVVVRGTWSMRSPGGFANSEGLLVFETFDNLTQPIPVPPVK